MKKNQGAGKEKDPKHPSVNATLTVKEVGAGGTSLSFTVPIVPEGKEDAQEVPLFNRLFPLLSGKKILVVDDQPLNRMLVIGILSPYGAELVEAENGAEALDCLGRQAFDMVLMDVQMPVMDGIDATRIIRRQLGGSLPVIALSANLVPGNVDRCMEAGMNAFLPKPYPAEALMEVIRSQFQES
jgi:CheY-like chemotaxis protein